MILGLIQLTSGPYLVHIWSRTPRISGGTKPSHSTEWLDVAADKGGDLGVDDLGRFILVEG